MNDELNDNIFYYPENLTEKTTYIAGWEWWAILIIAIGVLLSAILIVLMGLFLPLIFTLIFAICTLQISGASVYKFIIVISNFVFADQQIYFWSAERSQKSYD